MLRPTIGAFFAVALLGASHALGQSPVVCDPARETCAKIDVEPQKTPVREPLPAPIATKPKLVLTPDEGVAVTIKEDTVDEPKVVTDIAPHKDPIAPPVNKGPVVPKKKLAIVKKPLPKLPVLKRTLKPQPQRIVTKPSWDGLPEIPVTTLLPEDLTDIPGQYMIDLDPAAFTAAGLDLLTIPIADLAARLGLATGQIRSIQRRFMLSAVLRATPAQIAAITNNPLVANLYADTQIKAAGESLPLSWGLDRLDQPSLPIDGHFDRDFGDYTTRVYLFDTGVDRQQKEFAGRVKLGASFVDPLPHMTYKCRAHGTEMASLIAGETTGAAPKAEIVNLIVLPCRREQTGAASNLIEAVEWLLIREADFGDGKPAVANMSLAGKYSPIVNRAVAELTKGGVAVVVAAGNDGKNACRFSPASAKDAITVAATGPKDETPGFSNFGDCVDIYAPGRLITAMTEAPIDPFVAVNGTSGATALVSGLLACSLKEKGPTAASQWLAHAAVPAKLWRKDQSNLMLAQASSKWRNTCRIAPTQGGVAVRARPSTAGKVIKTLGQNAVVTVQQTLPNWVEVVSADGLAGWVFSAANLPAPLWDRDADVPCSAIP